MRIFGDGATCANCGKKDNVRSFLTNGEWEKVWACNQDCAKSVINNYYESLRKGN